MPQEIITWCDPCYAQDVKAEGHPYTIGLKDGAGVPPAKVVLLCQNHIDQLAKPLQQLLDEYGSPLANEPARRPKGGSSPERVSAQTTGPQQDKMQLALQLNGKRLGREPASGRGAQCLWCPLTYSVSGGFLRHLKVAHGFAGFKEAFGRTCPLCGGEYDQILGHCKKSHAEYGFESITDAFLWARDNGDPYGAYAAAVERKGSVDPQEAWEQTREAERASAAKGRANRGK